MAGRPAPSAARSNPRIARHPPAISRDTTAGDDHPTRSMAADASGPAAGRLPARRQKLAVAWRTTKINDRLHAALGVGGSRDSGSGRVTVGTNPDGRYGNARRPLGDYDDDSASGEVLRGGGTHSPVAVRPAALGRRAGRRARAGACLGRRPYVVSHRVRAARYRDGGPATAGSGRDGADADRGESGYRRRAGGGRLLPLGDPR